MDSEATSDFALYVGIVLLLLMANPIFAAEFFVDPAGADTESGSLAAPFRTIARAQEAVRESNANMASDIVVNLRAGTYRLDAPLVFAPRDGGNNGRQVVYRSYGNEKAIISGGRPITGWQARKDNVWEAPAGDGTFRQLFVNGRPAIRARTPNQGSYYRLQNWDSTHKAVDVRAADVAGLAKDSPFEFVALIDWGQQRYRVASAATDGGTAKLQFKQPDGDRAFALQWPMRLSGDPYFLEDSSAFLDAPGEWFLDIAAKKVLLIPPAGVDMARVEVTAPSLEDLIVVDGASRLAFEGILFEHTTWLGPDDGGFINWQSSVFKAATDGPQYKGMTVMPSAVRLVGATECRFDRCTFRNLGGGGIWLKSKTAHNTINACTFHEISGCAVTVGDVVFSEGTTDPGEAEAPRNDRITNNIVTRVAADYTGCAGIFATWCQGTVIEHNEVFDLPYTGISLGWGWTPKDGSLKNNIVRYNHVHHVMQLQSDGAGIYILSRQEGTQVVENYVHDITKSAWARNNIEAGIYTDQGSGGMKVNDNTVLSVEVPWHHNQESGDITGDAILFNATRIDAVKAEAGPQPDSGVIAPPVRP